MKKTILKAEKICKSFASNGIQNHVLDMLDIEIYEGDFTVIMGASGAGKSTLLYALSCMDEPTSGKVLYRGEEITGQKEHRMAKLRSMEFGFVFQQTHLISNLTLLENAAVMGYQNKELTTAKVRKKAFELLKETGVEDAANRLPSQVSGGEAQRAAIARAIINEPGIVFADEPTGALNKNNTKRILNIMTEINKKGQSIVMVTHDVRAAVRANRLIYIEDGKIIGEMTLPPYDEAEKKNREIQVNSWLTSLEW